MIDTAQLARLASCMGWDDFVQMREMPRVYYMALNIVMMFKTTRSYEQNVAATGVTGVTGLVV